MKILVTNDDGVGGLGMIHLARALRSLGEVIVVAPQSEMSASAHSLTLTRSLKVRRRSRNVFSVDGTPTDCVYLALFEIVGPDVDLVVSGINRGWNLGDDITYSGTVAAALEGTLLGRPSFAISMERSRPMRYASAAAFAGTLAARIRQHGLPQDIYLNVNVPCGRLRGVRIARQGKRIYHDGVAIEKSAKGETLYRIGGYPEWDEQPGSDIAAFRAGYITITPLKVDMTDRRAMSRIAEWRLPVPRGSARRSPRKARTRRR
jgi:5'-nucleotidase